jgi:hypothetical protein
VQRNLVGGRYVFRMLISLPVSRRMAKCRRLTHCVVDFIGHRFVRFFCNRNRARSASSTIRNHSGPIHGFVGSSNGNRSRSKNALGNPRSDASVHLLCIIREYLILSSIVTTSSSLMSSSRLFLVIYRPLISKKQPLAICLKICCSISLFACSAVTR